MALPTVTVTGTWRRPDDTAARGTVLFQLNTPLLDAAGDIIVPQVLLQAELDQDGKITIVLAATSGPGIAPASGVVYKITERIDGTSRTTLVALPHDVPNVDLADLLPVPGAPNLGWIPAASTAELQAAVAELEATDAALAAAVDGKVDLVEHGTTLGTTTADENGIVTVSFASVWRIDADGFPHYEPAGAPAGEEALLMPAIDGSLHVVKIGG